MPWWGWPLPLAAAALLAAEVHMGFPGVRSWLPYLVTIPVVVLLLLRMGSLRVEVSATVSCGWATRTSHWTCSARSRC